MNYWHMQLHPDDKTMDIEDIKKILEKEYIGLGQWEKGSIQIEQFKNNISIDDIVLIRHPGKTIIALVKVIGEYEYIDKPEDDILWFENRRKIKILSWYDENYNLPKNLGNAFYATTLQKCDSFKGSINNEEYTIGDYAIHWNRLIQNEKSANRILNLYSQLCIQAISSKHCNISKNDDFFISKISFKNLVDKFIATPSEENFRAFWQPKYVNSIQRKAIAENILKTNGTLQELHSKIVSIINLKVANNSNEFIKNIQNIITNSSYATLEFYYVYHMEDDIFPLINNGMKKGINYLLKDTLYEKYDEYSKFALLKNKLDIFINEIEEKSINFIDKYFFLLDQLLNLIDKIEENEVPDIQNQVLSDLFTLIKKIKFHKEKVMITEMNQLLKTQKQIILQGPPGTGKTRLAKQIANSMLIEGSISTEIDASIKDRVKLIQFHPSYSYEDFVRGIIAESNGTHIEYKVENKVLASMAEDAYLSYEKSKEKADPYVLIIDEINRANLSSVLGELIYALEYRGEPVESMYALKDGSNTIILPQNLYIIGTMNTADRSIGHIDYAIRRRFTFIDVLPNSKLSEISYPVIYKTVMSLFVKDPEIYDEKGTGKNSDCLSPEFNFNSVMLGHSYFIADEDKTKLKYQVLPLLKEYISDGILIENETTKNIILDLEKFANETNS